ncbi:DUF4254 domain-containing protein [Nocardia sp. NPDC004068]|uniref:DUF4254 domain-containing protein n=1 Tax=Nocardia sp. NPDC004068 TaxID=3364303 RepID=UPI0036C2D821
MNLISHDSPPHVPPSAEELCAAIRGHHIGEHPVLALAAEFGTLYQTMQASCTHQCCCPRVELVLAVDTWAADHLPVPCGGARMHTESLGAVIDRLARLQVHAYHLLMTADLTQDPQVHAAWYRLAELVEGYTDLTTELTRRSLRLPALGDGG